MFDFLRIFRKNRKKKRVSEASRPCRMHVTRRTGTANFCRIPSCDQNFFEHVFVHFHVRWAIFELNFSGVGSFLSESLAQIR